MVDLLIFKACPVLLGRLVEFICGLLSLFTYLLPIMHHRYFSQTHPLPSLLPSLFLSNHSAKEAGKDMAL